jgi:hypothetical protein
MKRVLAAALIGLLLSSPAYAQFSNEYGDRRLKLLEDPLSVRFTGDPEKISKAKMQQAVEIAALAKDWKLLNAADGRFELQTTKNGQHVLHVMVTYGEAYCEIRYIDSVDMMYKEIADRGRNLRVIHGNYNVWIRELADAIGNRVGQPVTVSAPAAPPPVVARSDSAAGNGNFHTRSFGRRGAGGHRRENSSGEERQEVAMSSAPAASPAAASPSAESPVGLAAAQSRNLAPGFTTLQKGARVVIMPVDIELFSISAGGVLEPKADWTEKALVNFKTALARRQATLGVTATDLSEPDADALAEINSLHAAVARAVALHHFGLGSMHLPTKEGKLDWSLGEAVRPIKERTGADYALFSWVRDSYASAERVATAIAFAALGVGIAPSGRQIGYASLVDLNTGRVLWFNRLVRTSGDLREPAKAGETINALLRDFPVAR